MSLRNRMENVPMETLQLTVIPGTDDSGNRKVYVSLHKIAFFTKKADMDDGIFVSDGVYFSPLVYLLYARNVVGGESFNEAKEIVRNILRESIDTRKSELERTGNHSHKVQLLKRALLLL